MRHPLIMIVPHPDPVLAAQGCRVSQGHHSGRYPFVSFGRRAKKKGTTMGRYILEVKLRRKLRRGEECMHRCHVAECVEPSHLMAGTHTQNERMKWAAGRGFRPQGERNHQSRLKEGQIRNMRRALAQGQSVAAVAAFFNVSAPHVRMIRSGKRWGHLSDAA